MDIWPHAHGCIVLWIHSHVHVDTWPVLVGTHEIKFMSYLGLVPYFEPDPALWLTVFKIMHRGL